MRTPEHVQLNKASLIDLLPRITAAFSILQFRHENNKKSDAPPRVNRIATPNANMGISQTKLEPTHPYYPPEASITGYVANGYSVSTLLAAFVTAETILLTTTYIAAKRWRPSISQADLLTVFWFVLCTCGVDSQCERNLTQAVGVPCN